MAYYCIMYTRFLAKEINPHNKDANKDATESIHISVQMNITFPTLFPLTL